MTTTEDLVLGYWRSWQGDDPDWAAMRAALADQLDMAPGVMPADQLVEMAKGGNRWSGVELIDSVFTDDQAAILYRGVDTVTGEAVEVAEFLTVTDGRISKLRGIFPFG